MNAPKPLSPTSILKLLASQGPGQKVELQPEHIAAFDAAIEALRINSQLRQLVAQGAPAERQTSRVARAERDAKEPSDKNPPSSRAPTPPRPTSGSGALWTADEEGRLSSRWERGDAIGAIAEAHERSAGACFARLVRCGAIPPHAHALAAQFLIKQQQPIALDNMEGWLDRAKTFGFEDPAPAGPMPRQEATAPSAARSPSP
jgi:hypothetical protein